MAYVVEFATSWRARYQRRRAADAKQAKMAAAEAPDLATKDGGERPDEGEACPARAAVAVRRTRVGVSVDVSTGECPCGCAPRPAARGREIRVHIRSRKG